MDRIHVVKKNQYFYITIIFRFFALHIFRICVQFSLFFFRDGDIQTIFFPYFFSFIAIHKEGKEIQFLSRLIESGLDADQI